MTSVERFTKAMAVLPLAAILRGLRPQEAESIGGALVDSGWSLIEVPINSPEPMRSIDALATCFPGVVIGAGTVLDARDVIEVHEAGARLVVAPNFDPGVAREASRLGMAYVPGVCTATEAFAALAAGATALKLFPAEMIPPAAVKALRAVLPSDTVLLPVGGINAANMAAYRSAGVDGFGIGSALFKPGMTADEVRQAALDFKAAWAGTMRA